MEENSSIWKNALTHGAILGLVMMLVAMIMYISNTFYTQSLQIIYYVVIVTTIVIGTIKQKKLDDEIMSYGRAFGTGTIISVVGAIIFSMFILVLFKYIDSGLIEKYLYETKNALIMQGYSDKEIEMAMMFSSKFPVTVNVFGYIMGFSFIGIMLSLITSIFLKSKNKNIA